MADVSASPVATPDAVTPKKAAKKEKKIARAKTSHPTTAIMVSNAIKNLKERGGSSLQAIKKYVAATYKVDAEKLAPFIKKYLKASVVSGSLVQTKGKGASGSFKLATQAVTKKPAVRPVDKKKPAAKPAPKKATAITTPARKAVAKKVVKPKRAVVEKKKPAPKVAVPKSPVKAKKTAKSPTKKPKSPKPKTTKSTRTAKKTTPKRK